LTREQAKQLVRIHDLEELSDYYVDDFVAYLGYSKEEFYLLLEKFRNRAIWQKDEQNRWYIPNHLEDGG
jgi:CTP:phosphocholine cytidylyltransferase-like protein